MFYTPFFCHCLHNIFYLFCIFPVQSNKIKIRFHNLLLLFRFEWVKCKIYVSLMWLLIGNVWNLLKSSRKRGRIVQIWERFLHQVFQNPECTYIWNKMLNRKKCRERLLLEPFLGQKRWKKLSDLKYCFLINGCCFEDG